jgi:flagellar biosynthetic protein FliO
MVIRRVVLSILWTSIIAAVGGLTPVLAGQADPKPTAVYVNAPPALTPAASADNAREVPVPAAMSPQPSPKTDPAVNAAGSPPQPSVAAPPVDFEARQIKKTDTHAQSAAEVSNKTVSKVTGLSPMRMIFALAAVLGLIFAGVFIFRRLTQNARGGHADRSVIRILSRNMIAPKQFVYLIKVGSRLLVVGVSPNHMTTLDAIDDPDEIARMTGEMERQQPGSITSGFSQLFHRQADDYAADRIGEQPDDDPESMDESGRRQWSQARGELHNLLDKVKSLSRLHFRSPMR